MLALSIQLQVVENVNRRTAESAYGGQNVELKNIVLFLLTLLLFEIPCSIFDIFLRTPHPAGGSPLSIFNLQIKTFTSAPQ
jgi:hypothetical protein